MKNRILALITIVASGAANLCASPLGDPGREAAAAYEAGQYERAIEIYRTMLESETPSAGILFDLGNAYVKTHDYGEARLCYERALRLDRGNNKIENNIAYVATQVDVQNRNDLKGKPANVSPDEPWFFRSVYNSFALDVKSDAWAMFAALAFVLFILFVADYIFTKRVLIRKFGFFGAMTMLGFTVLFLIFAFCAAHENDRHTQAVIMASKTELLDSPSDKAKSSGIILNRGTKVDIINTQGGTAQTPEWYDVRLNSDNSGWIRSSDLEKI